MPAIAKVGVLSPSHAARITNANRGNPFISVGGQRTSGIHDPYQVALGRMRFKPAITIRERVP
eukprot:6435584-Amphidinium_carterae.1